MKATSLEALEGITYSGKRDADKLKVLQAVKKYAPCTAGELSKQSGIDYEVIHKRVVDCERAGWIQRTSKRKCSVKGTNMLVIELANSVSH